MYLERLERFQSFQKGRRTTTEPGQARQPLIQEVKKKSGCAVEQRIKDRQDVDGPRGALGCQCMKSGARVSDQSLMVTAEDGLFALVVTFNSSSLLGRLFALR
jgi:hypothetical protein